MLGHDELVVIMFWTLLSPGCCLFEVVVVVMTWTLHLRREKQKLVCYYKLVQANLGKKLVEAKNWFR
jgi:hypothetical protein